MLNDRETTANAGSRIVDIAGFANDVTISLLDDIDETIESLESMSNVFATIHAQLDVFISEVSEKKVITAEYIDENDVAIQLLEKTTDTLKEGLPVFIRKRKAIDVDNRLKQHHCDALHEAYEKSIEEIAELIEALETARRVIITHDLKAEPRDGKVFDDIDDLISDLG